MICTKAYHYSNISTRDCRDNQDTTMEATFVEDHTATVATKVPGQKAAKLPKGALHKGKRVKQGSKHRRN